MTDDPQRTERTALDVLQGLLPVWLGGKRYVLPVLTTGENRAWQQGLDARLDPLIDSKADLASVLTELEGIDMLGLVYGYDIHGKLPLRETIEDGIYPHELLKAVFEVRLATNPTVAYAVAATTDELLAQLTIETPPIPVPRSSPPTKRSRRRTAGPTVRSGTS